MNDQAEEVYERMFHPNEIPQGVRELHDKAQFFVSRVDGQGMRLSQLALIAAIGSSAPGVQPTAQLKAHTDAMVDTGEADPEIPGEATGTPLPLANPAPTTAPAPGQATGPMDVPTKPGRKRNVMAHLSTMGQKELLVQARDMYKLELPGNTSKIKIIAAIKKVEAARSMETQDE